ncbi:hypothetical protein [Clostridium pasteurianum]|uniref:hypothetical protein n=1 Tax=Clostridium pasteurianum TaxID=1501 RepID=UPI00039C2949|nr:hypothetical protein [Clostridium pasteurianum]
MIFYKCNVCGLITNRIFKICPECGVESTKTKQEFKYCCNQILSNDNQLIKEGE